MVAAKTQPNGPASITDADLAAFVAEWTPRSICECWDPVYVYQSHKRTVTIHFNEIVDERRLMRISAVCERHYLRSLAAQQSAYVEMRKGAVPEFAAIVEFERALCKKDLYYLAKYILGYDRLNFHLHRFMASSVENLPPGYRGLREFPRDSYKSTVMTIGRAVQRVLQDPEVSILLKSNNETNISKKLEEIKNHFTPSTPDTAPDKRKRLPELFPEFAIKTAKQRGSGAWWKCPASQAVQEDGTLVASGLTGSKTSQHYDEIWADDLWDKDTVSDREKAAQVKEQMQLLEDLLASPGTGIVCYTGTRFSYDDPTDTLRNNPMFHCVVVSGILPSGRALFPENLPLRYYYGRATATDAGDEEDVGLYVFSCQHMLSPRREGMGFRREWLGRRDRYARLSSLAKEGKLALRRVILIDAAVAGKASSDNIAILTVALDSNKDIGVIDYIREKMSPSDFLNEVCRQWDKWHPDFVVRQNAVLETTLMSFVADRNKERKEKGLSPVKFYNYRLRKREKKARITASLQPRLQAGQIWFDEDLPHLRELMIEFERHPGSSVDDGLDALSELDDKRVCRFPELKLVPVPEPENLLPDKESLCHPEAIARRQAAAKYFAEKKKKKPKGHPGRVAA